MKTEATNHDEMLARELPRKSVALVLAGGRGSRLKDLTLKRAKPAVHFGGKFRIIDFALSNCLNSGIRRIGILMQYQSYTLIQHLQRGWSFLNEEANSFIDLLPAQQSIDDENWYASTGNAIYQNMDIIRLYNAEYTVILAGDHIYKMDYSKILLDHVRKGAQCTVACIPIPCREASAFGIMAIDKDEKILRFVEKPTAPPPTPSDAEQSLASMGIYVFNTSYLSEKLEEDYHDTHSSHDFGKDIIPKAVAEGVAWAHPFKRSCVRSHEDAPVYWRDVGTIEAYWRANLDMASVMPELDVYDYSWPIRTYGELLPPAKFVQDLEGGQGRMVNALVAAGCIISGSTIINSVLFHRVRVGSFCTIDSAVLAPDVAIEPACRLRRCIIDRGCYIPANMVIGEDRAEDEKRFYCSEEGIVVVTRDMLTRLGIEQLYNFPVME